MRPVQIRLSGDKSRQDCTIQDNHITRELQIKDKKTRQAQDNARRHIHKTRPGYARQDQTTQVKTRPDETRQHKATQGKRMKSKGNTPQDFQKGVTLGYIYECYATYAKNILENKTK